MQVYDDDHINDHQIAVNLFNSFGIPLERKRYFTVFSDSSGGYIMTANHFVPYGIKNINGQQYFLDYYGIYKLIDAAADYTFHNNEAGRSVIFVNDTNKQLFMGEWPSGRPLKSMEVTTAPEARHSELIYMYAADNQLNPARNRKEKKQQSSR